MKHFNLIIHPTSSDGDIGRTLKHPLETNTYGLFSPATAQIRKTEGKYGSWILNYLIDIPGATILYLQNPDDQGASFVGSK